MIHTLIIDDDALALSGLRGYLANIPYFRIEIVGQAKDKKNALRLIKELAKIDLVITDLKFKHETGLSLDGLEIIEAVKKNRKNGKVLVVTGDSETDWYDIVIGQKQANGILSKDFTEFDLAAAINTILNKNETYCSPKVAQMLQKRTEVRSDSQELRIPEKALAVLKLRSEGKSIEETASLLNCSKGYIDKVSRNLFQLFEVVNIAQLTKKAKEMGYI